MSKGKLTGKSADSAAAIGFEATAQRGSATFTGEAFLRSLCAAKDNQRPGELIDVIATIELTAASEREKTHRSVDLLGRVYDWSGATKTAAGSPQGERGGAHQYFLTRFASAALAERLWVALRPEFTLPSHA